MTIFGAPQRHLTECGSTNDVARAWAEDSNDPAPNGGMVTAAFQTQGRGQRGRQWQADAGQNALMSFVYRLPKGTAPSALGLLTALAVAEALERPGVSPQIKWPNDLLLEDRKVSGILVEVFGEFAILGIGINVNQDQFVGQKGYVYPPTSLRLVSGLNYSVPEVIEAVSRSLTHWENRLRQDGPTPILAGCRARLAVGAGVRQGMLCGTLLGLADSGAAQVRLADGTFAEWTTVN